MWNISDKSFLLPDYSKGIDDLIDDYKYEIGDNAGVPFGPDPDPDYEYHNYQTDGITNGIVENVTELPLGLEFENDDAAWVMACTFMIFTMQTGLTLISNFNIPSLIFIDLRRRIWTGRVWPVFDQE